MKEEPFLLKNSGKDLTMPKTLSVEWTERSLNNASEISNWILNKFSQKEVNKFGKFLRDFEKIISQFPDMFPESKVKAGFYQAVVHKNLSIYYTIGKGKITVIAMRDNRQKKIL